MRGDKLMLYDPKTGKFLVKIERTWTMRRGSEEKIIWTHEVDCAWSTTILRSIHDKKAQVGAGVKIVTESQARRIVEMMKLDDEYRARKREQAVLSFAGALPSVRGKE